MAHWKHESIAFGCIIEYLALKQESSEYPIRGRHCFLRAASNRVVIAGIRF